MTDKLHTKHYELIYDFSGLSGGGISNNGNNSILNTITPGDTIKQDFDLYGIDYSIRWPQSSGGGFGNMPLVGFAIGKNDVGATYWTNLKNTQQDDMLHFGCFKTFPIFVYSLQLGNPAMPIAFLASEAINLRMFVDNDTGSLFGNAVRAHLTIYYR